ncbi:serine/threonine protein phosphatase [Lewinellaceae bacterium SD302]|nr:serine/threonine protein phosphatase [Lewinellaceae bacterium SD302]
MTNGFARVQKLERELHLRQLQVQRLLQITQSINNNVSAVDLFTMYKGFLSNELELRKMALFVRSAEDDERWECVTQLGLKPKECAVNVSEELHHYKRVGEPLRDGDHPFFQHFNIIIPVLHKERPIAYVLVGDFNEQDDMYERVQIITTITNVIAVAIENKRLFKRQIEQERLEADLELGAQVQTLLIPKKLPTQEKYELSSIYRPVMGVGGDYFDYLETDDGKMVFCIGDFSGKGVSAALLMANFQANFHTLIRKHTGLKDFITQINDAVFRITNGERFVTFFMAEYELATGKLRYVNAGHPPAVLVTDDGIELLSKGTMVLGSFPDLPFLEVGEVMVPEQALLVTYTDGLTDLQSPAGEFFEEGILYDFARRQYGRSANDFNQVLLDKLEEFRGTTSYPDDLTILSCRIFNEN